MEVMIAIIGVFFGVVGFLTSSYWNGQAIEWEQRYAAQDEAMATLVSAVQERNETIAKLCKKIDWLESEWFEAEAVEGEQ